MSQRPALRSAEWVVLIYFLYVAALSSWFRLPPPFTWLPFAVAFAVAALLSALVYGEWIGGGTPFNMARDWIPMALVLVGYREMNWFTPRQRDYHLEMQWIEWDRLLLYHYNFQHAIEVAGSLIPNYLEFCYLLVYAVGPFTVAILYILHRRYLVNRVLLVYLLGTLSAYALFPYFPSEPPRSVFGASDLPNVAAGLRELNLFLVGNYGIHSSVFPSAHVSSAFSAAWAFMLFLPDKKWLGCGMLVYASSVAIAVVYGRYHYAVDALSGFGISLIALAAGIITCRMKRVRS